MICPVCTLPFTPDARAGNRAKTCPACRSEWIRRRIRDYARDIKEGKRVRAKTYSKPRHTKGKGTYLVTAKCPACPYPRTHLIPWNGEPPRVLPRVYCKDHRHRREWEAETYSICQMERG